AAEPPAGGHGVAARGGPLPLPGEITEDVGVQTTRLVAQAVAPVLVLDAVSRAEVLAQLVEVDAQVVLGGGRRLGAPERVDEAVAGDRGSGVAQQDRQDQPLAHGPDRDGPPVPGGSDVAEDSEGEVFTLHGHRSALRRRESLLARCGRGSTADNGHPPDPAIKALNPLSM